MQGRYAERRFMALLACALAALGALAIVAGRPGEPATHALAAPAHLASPSVGSDLVPPSQSVLAPLLSTAIWKRSPHLDPPRPGVLAHSQIVSYYGSVYTPNMGILGEGTPEEIADQLAEHAAVYDSLNGSLGVVPAMHLVYAVAQPEPTRNGLYLQYAGDEDVRRFIALTRERDMLLFLDIQVGRSSVETELRKILPYLRYANVHLALDPEFAMSETQVPGDVIGSLHAADIDEAQATLQALVESEGLPPKLLIVHQFADSMVVDGDDIKRAKYEHYASRSYAAHAAIKLFFQHDPDLMSEADVLALVPGPAVVIYQ